MNTSTLSNITEKKSVRELTAMGYNLKAYSSGGDLLVQSFIAVKNGRRIHGWFRSGLNGPVTQSYEITPA